LLLAGVVALLLIGGSCAFLRISCPRDIEAYLGTAAECHPIWKQFALRRFGPGDAAQELFRRFPPTQRSEFGRYGVYTFSTSPSNAIPFTSLLVATRDGKLISAASGSCTWRFTFFSTEDPELEHQYAAFVQERRRKAEQNRLERLQAALQKFYGEYDRWPTNVAEFGCFVMGEKPRTDAGLGAESKFKGSSYCLGQGSVPSFSNNPLGITLKPGDGGALIIALNGEPGLIGTVAKPGK